MDPLIYFSFILIQGPREELIHLIHGRLMPPALNHPLALPKTPPLPLAWSWLAAR